ncbi:MAG: hypothetical protein IT357_02205 [Gemmatimonadaceae bacterium]|nr:hypothetical protein [Gemmatimonadaceae bacterium]
MEGAAEADLVSRFSARGRWLIILAVAAGMMGNGSVSVDAARAATGSEPRHDTHVSHTRLILDGKSVVARVRVFHDDLEKALHRSVARDAATQTAFTQYLESHFLVRADGVKLSCRIEEQDADADPSGEKVWWAIVQCDAAKPIRTLGLVHSLFFEVYRDQQNLVTVIKAPEDERRALYFHTGDVKEQTVRF